MSTILFFDTETTGLPDFRAPSDAENQPHVVQMAGILCNEAGKELSSFSLIINPGIPIPKEVSSIHGITDKIAGNYGISPAYGASLFAGLYQRADLVCGHNISFDVRIMRILLMRIRGRDDTPALDKPTFCTMRKARTLVNAAPSSKMMAAGMRHSKPPRLGECVKFFFGEELDGAHDAMVDVRACKRIYFHMKEMEQ